MKTSIYDKLGSVYQGGKELVQKSSDKMLLGYITLDNALNNATTNHAQVAAQQPNEAGFGGFLFFAALSAGSVYAKKSLVPKIKDESDRRKADIGCLIGTYAFGLISVSNLISCACK